MCHRLVSDQGAQTQPAGEMVKGEQCYHCLCTPTVMFDSATHKFHCWRAETSLLRKPVKSLSTKDFGAFLTSGLVNQEPLLTRSLGKTRLPL